MLTNVQIPMRFFSTFTPQIFTMSKAAFLKNDLLKRLKAIAPSEKARWGLMNVQQMIEHLSSSFRQANGKSLHTIVTPADQVDKYKSFMMSDKPFKENTKNVQLPDTPFPVKHSTLNEAYAELELEINDFFKVFETEPNKIITNPIFGHLNFDEWVHLLHKHA